MTGVVVQWDAERDTAQDVATLNLWKILNLRLEICDEVHRRRFLSANCKSYLQLEQEQGLIFLEWVKRRTQNAERRIHCLRAVSFTYVCLLLAFICCPAPYVLSLTSKS